MIQKFAIGRNIAEVWENTEEFCPKRFIDNSSIEWKGQDLELIPFGAGRRICPGLNMGEATVELALANLLYKFDWEMPIGMKREDIDTEVIPGISMRKKNPLMLLAKESIKFDEGLPSHTSYIWFVLGCLVSLDKEDLHGFVSPN
ncbi:cytochrome P450 71B36-like [Tripterygium wilfordii]|uniref:cytochrome P450 71B36-like n=1 Tax=Tripterygium wilfordii TaxID=458696 RepID=UPI0018F84382|nr:cytochrome P450 71B36-like [Tripterygium wilfordii]